MKRVIISLLFIITVLCGYFYEKQKTIVYQKEVNEGLQQYLNERNNDEERASSHVRKDVIDYTNQRLERREIAPSPLKQLKTQFMQPFKGRAFQELLDMSESLNSILHCDTLDVTQRASILSQITNKPYSEMNALVSEVSRNAVILHALPPYKILLSIPTPTKPSMYTGITKFKGRIQS